MDETKFKDKWLKKISEVFHTDIKIFDMSSNQSRLLSIQDQLYKFLQYSIWQSMKEFSRERKMYNDFNIDTKEELNSKNSFHLYLIGSFHEDVVKFTGNSNRIEHAIKAYEEAIKHDKGHPASYSRLSVLYKKYRTKEDLIKLLEQGIKDVSKVNPGVANELQNKLNKIE